MNKKVIPSPDLHELLAHAEKELESPSKLNIAKMPREDIALMIHELETHQIELEMQNAELRKTQDILATIQERYAELYEQAPVGYLTTSNLGVIHQANLTCAKLLGVPKSTLASQSLTAFIFNDDQDIYYAHRNKLLETAQGDGCELRLCNAQGDMFWGRMDSTCVTSIDSACSVIRTVLSDITEHKQMQLSEARYRMLFELARDSMVLIDPLTQDIEDCNQAAYKDLGYTKDEFMQLQLSDIETNRSPGEIESRIDTLIQTGSDAYETRHKDKGGQSREVAVKGKAISISGKRYLLYSWCNI